MPALRRYALGLTHDADLADDLVQDCLERAIRKRRLWRPSGALRAWLFRMLLNIHRNDLRRNKRIPAQLPIDDLELAGRDGMAGRVELRETVRAMAALPQAQREALLLIAVEELSYTEAAKVLGIPAGTLMSRLMPGRGIPLYPFSSRATLGAK